MFIIWIFGGVSLGILTEWSRVFMMCVLFSHVHFPTEEVKRCFRNQADQVKRVMNGELAFPRDSDGYLE